MALSPPKPLSLVERCADLALKPVMFVLGGFKRDSIQETHYWHCEPINPSDVDPKLCVIVEGDDESSQVNRIAPLPFFHAPILGGWTRHVVLENLENRKPWHVGWIHLKWPQNARPRAHVQRMPISERRIRVLKQAIAYSTQYFGVTADGRQVKIGVTGEGILGDSAYPETRLF